MASVKVRNLEIGAEFPKICVPIVDKKEEDIMESARNIVKAKADLVEWRVDWFEDIFDLEKVQEILEKLRQILGECPLLFTCRTAFDGGEIILTPQQYEKINLVAIESSYVDMIDIEIFNYPQVAMGLRDKAHSHNLIVVGSTHDFHSTPSKIEMVGRIVFMQKMGVDIPKLAVMPQNELDVLNLLEATEEIVREYGSTPVVTMSMGPQGVISRIAGKIFGSSITFGTVGKASAPGQLDVEELRTVMKILR